MRISGQVRDNCTHNEQLYISYLSLDVINIIKLRMVGWVGHMACTGEREKYTKTSHSALREETAWKLSV